MAQIKLGFDRVPVPFIKSLQPLYDIVRGVPLRDANNNPIVTETEIPIPSLANASKATSVTITNNDDRPVQILEAFPQTSQVSSTLLGIPRAETQISLFADVSTYGLNPEEFDFYSFNNTGRPSGWYTRRNPTYGRHYSPRLREFTEEQALVIEAYPVNYNFARGPRFEGYNPEVYDRFVKFIQLGNQLYTDYKDNYPEFARNNFLNPEEVTVRDGEALYRVDEDDGYFAIEKWTLAWMDMRDGNLNDPKNPGKSVRFFQGFGADETRPGSGSGGGYYGLLQSRKTFRYQPGRISGYTFGFKCSTDDASVDNIIEWGIGNPTDQYIFQVRGAAFSIIRRSTVPLPNEIIEQQGLNPSDQTIVGSAGPVGGSTLYELVIPRENFNGDTLDGNGPSGYLLDPEKVTMYKIEFGWYGAVGAKFYVYIPTDYGGARWVLVHTLVIENQIREPCLEDPNFKLRYSLNITDTSNLRSPQFLYKYGASCYIDGGDQDSAKTYSYTSEDNIVNANNYSPLMGIYPKDTLSNTDGYEKPNKNSVYPSTLKVDTDQLTEIQLTEVTGCPAFGHHYAPSLHSNIIGIQRGIEIVNNGQSISILRSDPVDIENITNSMPTEITLTENHNYFTGQKVFLENISGMTELNNQEFYVVVTGNRSFYLYADTNLNNPINSSDYDAYVSGGSSQGIPIFRPEQDDAKIIDRGLYSSYIQYKSELEADIARLFGYNKRFNETLPLEVNLGEIVELSSLEFPQVRFTNFDAIAASPYPFTGDAFDVNFLNPTVRDSDGQFAEFLIGVTEYEPVLEQVENLQGDFEEVLKFRLKDGATLVDPDLDDLLYEEFTQSGITRDRDGFETGEGTGGSIKMDIDYRLGRPGGEDSGECSSIRFRIEPRLSYTVSYANTNPENGSVGNFVIFDSRPSSLIGGVKISNGEFGVGNNSESAVASGIRFISNVAEYVVDPLTGQLGYYAEIDGVPEENTLTIWLSPVTIADRNSLDVTDPAGRVFNRRIFSFEPKPLYLVIRFRDRARINNITITEFFPDGRNSFCPEWITNEGVNVISSGNSQTGVPAADYKSTERLESTSIDTALGQPLRPGIVRDTIYVAPNTNEEINLENIYGPDRTTITPGLLNTTATFLTARSLEDNSLNIVNINLNTKE